LLRRVDACACGNAYLRDYAMQYCANSIILPTVVDTTVYRPAAERPARPVTIGWIGSPSTWPNVRPLLPLLEELARTQGIRVRVVGAGRAVESDRFPGLDIVEWSEASEVADVQAMDIGIMPLRDRPFERGKSGYKLIQYMACGLPTVASPIGVNSEIVEDGTTGLLASGNEEWRGALTRLIGNPDLRRSFGLAGRRKAEARYSLAAQASRLIDLLRSVGAC
jgi:glycosyltransferase involved in cell wall biosynthesis